MNNLNRRDFIRITGLGAATAATGLSSLNRRAKAESPQNIVIVGGGFAGATAAKYLVEWAAAEGLLLNVTLIDRNSTYSSPILSNLVLVGKLSKAKLDFTYTSLKGVNFVRAEVTSIEAAENRRRVWTSSGQYFDYDRLVLAPGIDFLDTDGEGNQIAGLQTALDDGTIIPAWKGGAEVLALRNQLLSMPTKNPIFILSIPKAPYRCPPGPYERACVVADWLKKNRKNGKVIVLDANPGITAEKDTFSAAFNALGVEYKQDASLTEVSFDKDSKLWTVNWTTGTSTGHVLNVLPRQRSGKVLNLIPEILKGGLFAPVHGLTYESTEIPFIHVIGDAQATSHPKAGHVGNGEGKVCANAIIEMLRTRTETTAAYIEKIGKDNIPPVVTNSACYSPIKASSAMTASYLTVGYRAMAPDWVPIKDVATVGEASAPNADNWEDMLEWAENLYYDTFNVIRNVG